MSRELIQSLDEYVKLKRYRLINSVLAYKGDTLIFERYYNKYTDTGRNNIKSIWKSILSILTGICLDHGFIKNTDEPIYHYLPDFNGSNHPYHRLITIKHLLTMTSGIYWNGGIRYHCPMLEQWFRSKHKLSHIADIKMSSVPGSAYVYKEWDVILLSAVIAAATGKNTYDFCKEYLYRPLSITSEDWWTSSCGLTYNIADNDVHESASDLSAKDLAKLGFLFLNEGTYENKRILSREYIKEALTPSIKNNGYGYLWWLGHGWYGCRGYGGQEITVLPKERVVYVIQATPSSLGKSYGDVFEEVVSHI